MVLDFRPVPVTVAPARRLPQLLGGLALYGISSGLLLRFALGPQPWGVLSEALSGRTARTGRSLRWVLGGTAGAGTVVYALAVGPLTQLFLPRVVWK